MRTLAFLLLFFLFADGKEECLRFFPDAIEIYDGRPSYAVAENRFVSLYCPPSRTVVARDTLTGLCLFEKRAKRSFRLIASPRFFTRDGERKMVVRPLLRPAGVVFGRLAPKPRSEGALFGKCCELAGLVDAEGAWRGIRSIRRLLAGRTWHGDIGLRFAKGKTRVVQADPFAGDGLYVGDRIVAVEGKRVSWRKLLNIVDECRPESSLRIGFVRDGKERSLRRRCFLRRGGGVVSDTFLERFGLRFDERMRIVSLDEKSEAKKRGLHAGDRLLSIDGEKVTSQRRCREILSRYVGKPLPQRFLWERKGFQFFFRPFSL